MARKKVTLAYIQTNTVSKNTYNKRVRRVLKKAEELSTLCGVDTCMVINSSYSNDPVIFPSNDAEVRKILLEYKSRSEINQVQMKFNHEEFLIQSLNKLKDKSKRLEMRMIEMNMENITTELLNSKPIEEVPHHHLKNLIWVIEDRLRSVDYDIRKVGDLNNGVDLAGNPNQMT